MSRHHHMNPVFTTHQGRIDPKYAQHCAEWLESIREIVISTVVDNDFGFDPNTYARQFLNGKTWEAISRGEPIEPTHGTILSATRFYQRYGSPPAFPAPPRLVLYANRQALPLTEAQRLKQKANPVAVLLQVPRDRLRKLQGYYESTSRGVIFPNFLRHVFYDALIHIRWIGYPERLWFSKSARIRPGVMLEPLALLRNNHGNIHQMLYAGTWAELMALLTIGDDPNLFATALVDHWMNSVDDGTIGMAHMVGALGRLYHHKSTQDIYEAQCPSTLRITAP